MDSALTLGGAILIIKKELVQRVKAYGGRFLRKDDGDKFWSEVSDDDARKKASQGKFKL